MKKNDEEENAKIDSIIDLENSGSFARTHEIIKTLSAFTNWSDKQIEQLCLIAKKNSQVHYILKDDDVKRFYQNL